jgi:hypothetical protein
LVGEAGRFPEPITDGAGKEDLLRGAPVDQVADTDEDRTPDANRKMKLAQRRQAAKEGAEKATGKPDPLTSFL